MDDKKMLLLALSGMLALSLISAYIAIHGSESERETIIVIDSESSYESVYVTETTEICENSVIDKTETYEEDTPPSAESITETEPLTETLWVNINTADISELAELHGIGEILAARIVEYRDINGGFRNIEEIINVDGIGEKKFEAIRASIYVEYPTYEEETDPSAPEEVISEEITSSQEESEPIPAETTDEPATEHIRTLDEAAPININTADVQELMLLPHVTEEIAEHIISLRNDIDGYSHPYELLYIEELEQNQVAEIVEFVTVG